MHNTLARQLRERVPNAFDGSEVIATTQGGAAMDERRFDTLTKALGSGTSRRWVLRGLLGSSVAGVAVVSRTLAAQAARKCGPGTSNPCPRDQLCVNGRCGRGCSNPDDLCPASLGATCCTATTHCCVCPVNEGTIPWCAAAGDSCDKIFFGDRPCEDAPGG